MPLTVILYRGRDIQRFVHRRTGERKLGQAVRTAGDLATLARLRDQGVRYALLGIPESIGPMANYGRCCTDHAWNAFLGAFLNMQSNHWLTGARIVCLGHVDTAPLVAEADRLDASAPWYHERLRALCARLDERVSPVIKAIAAADLVPIVIGGGHNNAYPLIKGAAAGLAHPDGIHCFNCDAHADLRRREGRHSGNGFTYAMDEGYLGRYYVFGLQEPFTPQYVLEAMDAARNIAYCRFAPDRPVAGQLDPAVAFLDKGRKPVGLEVDMDALADMPASAVSPSGLSVDAARCLVREVTARLPVCYLHLTEGAPRQGTPEELRVGKTLALLVYDFIRARG